MTEIEAGPSFPTFIVLNLHPDDPGDWIHIQRSVDGTTSGIDGEARVPGTQERYFDRVAPTQGGSFYRTRGIGPTTCTDPSDWTAWRKARGVVQPGPSGSKTPVGKEVPHQPGSTFNLEQKTNLIGQLWKEGSTSNLNLRSYDATTGDGQVEIEWNASEFLNGGESIAIESGLTSVSPDTKHFLYHDAADADEVLTTNADNISDWPHMKLGEITSASEGSTQGSTGEVSGPPTEPL